MILPYLKAVFTYIIYKMFPDCIQGDILQRQIIKNLKGKKKEPVFFILHIYLSKLSVQLFAILLVTLVTVVFRFSYIINSIFIINSFIYFPDIINS